MKKIVSLRKIFLAVLGVCMFWGFSISADAAPKSVQMSKLTFDVDYYYSTYSDLQTAIGYDDTALYNHYLQYGLREGRSGSAEFNCLTYMNNYSDLRAAFKGEYTSYCLHYEQFGKNEGRNAVEQFGSVAEPAATESNVIGSYSTSYDATIPRAVNVVVAASRINGVVLQPGQAFSYSKTILPRTPENGYVEAPVISGGRYIMGYGGGICQVSSTLYAAMLDAGLPATERHAHSLAVEYVPLGMDATIASNVKDLKFVNIYDSEIQISATTDDESGTLTVSIIKR